MDDKIVLKSYISSSILLESKYNKETVLLNSFICSKKYLYDNIITKDVFLKSYIDLNIME